MDLARSVLKIFAGRSIKSVTSFAAIVVFSRELGASPLGTFYPFIALLGLLSIPADFGIRNATEKRISEGTDTSEFLGSAIILKIPVLIVIGIAIMALADIVNFYLGADLAILLVLTLFAKEGGSFTLSILRGEMRVEETALLENIRPFCWLLAGYFFYIQGFGVYALIYGYLIGSIVTFLVGLWKISTQVSKPTINHIRSLLDFGKYSMITNIGGYFYSWMDVAMLTAFVALEISSSRSAIGAYENAWRVSMVIMLFSGAIGTSIFPQVSRWNSEGAIQRIERLIPIVALPALLLAIPAFAGTLVLSKEILGILFGPEFTVAWLVLIILAAEKVIQSVHTILAKCLQALDRPDLTAQAALVSILINISLNIVLIWHHGIIGAAVATTISFSVNTILHAHYLNRFLEINLPIYETSWSIVASVVMGILLYWFRRRLSPDTFLELIVLVISGIVIYTLVLLMNQSIRGQIQNRILVILSG